MSAVLKVLINAVAVSVIVNDIHFNWQVFYRMVLFEIILVFLS